MHKKENWTREKVSRLEVKEKGKEESDQKYELNRLLVYRIIHTHLDTALQYTSSLCSNATTKALSM